MNKHRSPISVFWNEVSKVLNAQALYNFDLRKVKNMPESKFEIHKDAAGKFRFRLRAPNNEIIAVSEAYETKDSCKNGIQSVKTNAPRAEITDLT